MTSSRTALAVAALALAAPLAACSGSTSATPASTVTVTAPATSTSAAPTGDTAAATTETGSASQAPTTTVEESTATGTTDRPTTQAPATTVTVTATQTATQTPTTSASPTTSRATASVPTLGVPGGIPSGVGRGTVRPSRIYYGGDPTGDASGITWSRWGGKVAIGHGYSWYVAPGKAVSQSVKAPVTIRAYDLTTCDGHPAYRHVTWWFPTKGETAPPADAASYDLCDKG